MPEICDVQPGSVISKVKLIEEKNTTYVKADAPPSGPLLEEERQELMSRAPKQANLTKTNELRSRVPPTEQPATGEQVKKTIETYCIKWR